MIPTIDPIQAAKLAVILLALAGVGFLAWSRGHALEIIKQQQALISMYEAQGAAQRAEAARKQAAYAEAKRKADNDAKDLLGRIAWLKKQSGKGCESAARVLREYRGAK